MLEVRSVSKSFGAQQALRDVSVTFLPGEIHAVIGENGAGKSTLMGVMSGFIVPDSGSVQFDGVPVPSGKPFACKHLGIEMIHQHFTLVPQLTVAENLALTQLEGVAGLARVEARSLKALKLAAKLGWEVDPSAKVQNLPVGVQQRVEVVRALASEARVLIFDEPTAVLAPQEVEDLLRVLRTLRDDGRIVILIAHKLSEVMACADVITVLRQGKVVAHLQAAEANVGRLADLMVGDMPAQVEVNRTVGQTYLVVDGLSVKGDRGNVAVDRATFEVKSGEVFGIGGVDGNGQIELAEALVGIRSSVEGSINVADDAFSIGYIPQDRQLDGLAMGMSLEDNLLVGGLDRKDLTKGAFLRKRSIANWAKALIKRFEIKARSPRQPVADLSGGNQQKIVVSRNLDRPPHVLVAINPTRGLDVRAIEYVHLKIREACAAGTAVVLLSTDLDELSSLSDRTVYMSRGKLVDEAGALALVGGK